MDILLKFQCQSCDKEFMVLDEQVETDLLSCPHCQECVDVGDEDRRWKMKIDAAGVPTTPLPGD